MEEEEGDILDSFVKQFYAGTPFIPRELWLQYPVADEKVISQWLTARKGQKVKLVVPQKGQKERLVELAARNAALVLGQDKERLKRDEQRTIGAVRHDYGGLWESRAYAASRPTIFPIPAEWSPWAPWWFTRTEGPSAAIIGNSKSARSRDQTITLPCGRC